MVGELPPTLTLEERIDEVSGNLAHTISKLAELTAKVVKLNDAFGNLTYRVDVLDLLFVNSSKERYKERIEQQRACQQEQEPKWHSLFSFGRNIIHVNPTTLSSALERLGLITRSGYKTVKLTPFGRTIGWLRVHPTYPGNVQILDSAESRDEVAKIVRPHKFHGDMI